jgi:hypothetical protein
MELLQEKETGQQLLMRMENIAGAAEIMSMQGLHILICRFMEMTLQLLRMTG